MPAHFGQQAEQPADDGGVAAAVVADLGDREVEQVAELLGLAPESVDPRYGQD
ncbi:hypothetical protein [Streptomyces sp. A1136]|uniref:hypothetical protein n=1 Tax=Streptomyces sp. A1136 TaxID=2563102 RepID=UPI001445482E|nr:hypothetical protein [Streptomyces sp. A1136]